MRWPLMALEVAIGGGSKAGFRVSPTFMRELTRAAFHASCGVGDCSPSRKGVTENDELSVSDDLPEPNRPAGCVSGRDSGTYSMTHQQVCNSRVVEWEVAGICRRKYNTVLLAWKLINDCLLSL